MTKDYVGTQAEIEIGTAQIQSGTKASPLSHCSFLLRARSGQ